MLKLLLLIFLFVFSCAVKEEQTSREWLYYYDLGMSSYVAKNYSDAIANFYKASQIAPREPKVWNALGLAYMEAKEYEKAESSFKKALGVNPKYTEAKMNLGILYYNSKKYQKAEEALKESLKDDTFSQKHVAYYYLAKVYKELSGEERWLRNLEKGYKELNDDEGYLRNLEKAVAYNPMFLEAQLELAQEYERRGEYKKARDVYLFLINNNLDNPTILLGLANVYYKMGNYDDAKNVIRNIIERRDSSNFVKAQAYDLLNKVLIEEQERKVKEVVKMESTKENLKEGITQKPKETIKTESAKEDMKESTFGQQESKNIEKPEEKRKNYAIQLGSFTSYKKAEAFKRKLERSLKNLRVIEQSGMYKVIYGDFESREEANKARKEILKNFNILGFIVEQ